MLADNQRHHAGGVDGGDELRHLLRRGAGGGEDADLPAVVLETAHPAKFHEEMKKLLGFEPQVPSALAQLNPSKETYSQMLADFSCLKEFLLSKASG